MGLFGSASRRLLGALGACVLCLLPNIAPGGYWSSRDEPTSWAGQARRALAAEGDAYLWGVGGAGTLRSAGQSDAFVAKYGLDGALRTR